MVFMKEFKIEATPEKTTGFFDEEASLLSPLTRHQSARLLAQIEPCIYQEGDIIQQAGDPAHYFHHFMPDSASLAFGVNEENNIFEFECGEECFAGISHYLFTVTATGETRGWKLAQSNAQQLGKESGGLRSNAMLHLAKRFRTPIKPESTQPKPSRVENRAPILQSIGWLFAIIAPPVFYLYLNGKNINPGLSVFISIMLEVIILWLFSLVEQFIAPIIGIAAAIFTGLVSADKALSGFASSSFFELLCVLTVSSVLMSSGLSFRLLLLFLGRLPSQLTWQIQIPLVLGFIISPIIPSNNSRVALLIPIMNEITHLSRLNKWPVAATAMLAGGYSASVIFSNMLPTSKATTIALMTTLPSEVRADFNGLLWLKAAAIVTFGMLACHLLLNLWLFRMENVACVKRELIHEGLRILGPVSFEERVAIICILALVIGTMTYEYHHIPMSSISGLIIFSLLSLGLISKSDFRKEIDWTLVFFLIGSQCLIQIAQSLGIDSLILDYLSGINDWIEENPWRFVSAIILIIIPLRFMIPGPPTALLATSLFNPIAIDNHINPWMSLFICGFLSDIWFLPYQSGSWTQVQSMPIAKNLKKSKFTLYNIFMNLSRLLIAYLCIPYWQWLDIL